MAHRWRAELIGGGWALGTVGALVLTLPAVAPGKNFDGLNNLFQIPFALPWFLIPLAPRASGVASAWIAAGMGILNAALIFVWVRRREGGASSTHGPA